MYALRDNLGNITAISEAALPGYEQLDESHPDLLQFLKKHLPASSTDLFKTDVELARVLEDLIDILTHKGVFHFTELPEAAQDKLLRRKKIRSNSPTLDLIGHEDSEDDFLL